MSNAWYFQDCVYPHKTDRHFEQVHIHKQLLSQTTSLSSTSQCLIFLPCSPICIQGTSCLLCLCPLYHKPNFAVFKVSTIVPCQTEPLNNQFGIVWKRKCLQNSQSPSLHRKQDLSSALFQTPNFQPGKGQTCCKPQSIPCYLTVSKELKHLEL